MLDEASQCMVCGAVRMSFLLMFLRRQEVIGDATASSQGGGIETS
jgi:hypothetical protein